MIVTIVTVYIVAATALVGFGVHQRRIAAREDQRLAPIRVAANRRWNDPR